MRIDDRARRLGVALLIAVCAAGLAPIGLTAQGGSVPDDVQRQIRQRFDILQLTDGIVLTPRARMPGVRSIELAKGVFSIDGVVVTGPELRNRLGPDAENVLRLTYFDDAALRAMVSGGPAAPAA